MPGLGRSYASLGATPALANGVDFSPNGWWLASAGGDGTVRLWEAETGREVETFRGHEGKVADVRFSRDGTRLVSTGAGGIVKIWEILLRPVR